jgi:hypothetical protein
MCLLHNIDYRAKRIYEKGPVIGLNNMLPIEIIGTGIQNIHRVFPKDNPGILRHGLLKLDRPYHRLANDYGVGNIAIAGRYTAARQKSVVEKLNENILATGD